ncbi:9255_t:CDS:1, partial [Cetraspora pellucida]
QALVDTVLEVNIGECYWIVASETKQGIRYSVEKNLENDKLKQQFL